MERISKDELDNEFGPGGLEHPAVVDLIRFDEKADKVVLVMREPRAWSHGVKQLQQLQEKIDRYLGYVLEGFLFQHYPQYKGKHVRLELHCAEHPHSRFGDMLNAAKRFCGKRAIDFAVRVGPLRTENP